MLTTSHDGLSLLVLTSAAVLERLLSLTPPTWLGASCFLTVPILFFVRCAKVSVWFGTGLGSVAIACFFHAIHHEPTNSWLVSLAFGVGSASLLSSVGMAGMASDSEREAAWRTVAAISLFPVKLYVGLVILSLTASMSPLTYDGYLAAVDQSLGGNASFAIGRLLLASPALNLAASIAYEALPIAVMIAAALRWRRFGAADPTSIPLAAGLAAALAVGLYLVVPGTGPVFTWGALFPLRPPSSSDLGVGMTAVDPHVFRNAMPSLHFTGALFIAWGTWALGKGARTFGLVFLAATALATLGTGQHYAIDLIVAVPYALAIEMAVRRQHGWWKVCAVGGGLTLFWLAVLRAAPQLFQIPGLTWIFVGITVAGLSFAVTQLDGSPLKSGVSRINQVAA